MPGPLAGIRVVDLTMTVLGPFAAQILGDMGADVIKVETPAGDTLRSIGAKRSPLMGALFLQLNRNKRSIVLDLKQSGGRNAMLRLLGTADVFLYAYRPQAMQRLGLDAATLGAQFPRLIICGAFGFGQGGRYADRPAYDDLIQGSAGLAALEARVHGAPSYVPLTLADRTVGLSAASAVGMALFERERSGRGQSIDVPMFETLAQFTLGDHLYGRTFEPPIGPSGYPRLLEANRRPYKTQDGYLCFLPYTNAHWQRLFALAERPDMAADARFTTPGGRTESIDELYAFVAAFIATRTTQTWLDTFRDADIPAAPMHDIESLIGDPHIQDTAFVTAVEHPTEGRLRLAGIPTTWSRTQPEITRLPPRLGEHTREVLTECGLTTSEIDEHLGTGAIFLEQ